MAGMLTTGMSGQSTDGMAPGADATKSMYHDYLTNPNSTYAQDPSLAPQLKSAIAPGVVPGSLTGDPAQVAKQGLTPGTYNQVYGTNMIDYNGQQVLAGQQQLDSMKEGADSYNKALGKNLSPMEYDKMINPTTYGARWGIPADQMQAPASGGVPTGTGTLAAPVGAQGYSAAQTAVTPGMLASGNLNSIMDPNSPLMVQAATQGNQQSNARGLQNSSIGISAAQDSMLKAAVPIAQQDAQTQAGIAQTNTGAVNAAGQFGASAANTAALTAQQLASQKAIATQQTDTQKAIATQQAASQQAITKANNDTSISLSKMSTETQAKMAGITQENQKVLQSNSQAATAMANYAATVANIEASKDMDGTAKQAAVDTQLTNLRNTLAALGSQSGQDLAQFFPMLAQVPVTTDTSGNGMLANGRFTG